MNEMFNFVEPKFYSTFALIYLLQKYYFRLLNDENEVPEPEVQNEQERRKLSRF